MTDTVIQDRPSLSDAALIAAFEDGSLSPDHFTHRDHLRLGYLYLTRHDFGEAVHRLSNGLRRIVAKLGRPEKYHETITVAFMALINERMQENDRGDWQGFAAANPDLFEKDLLLRYYPREALASARARRAFLLQPLAN